MKKIIYSLMAFAMTTFALTSCEDIPSPYDIPGSETGDKALYYESTSLSGFTTYCLTDNEPWSKGSSYTQATGYQDWDGTGSKTNVEVKSYLISPKFKTICESGKVKFSFDQTLRYTNNVSGWENNHKIFISKDYDGSDFEAATWEQIAFTPVASPYTDWTLYSSGEIQIPEAYINQEAVYIAFYFYAPATASTTWELKNFIIEEGEAQAGENPTPGPSVESSEEAPLAVSAAKAATGNQYVKGYIVGYIDGTKLEEGAVFAVPSAAETEVLIAESASETNPANTLPVQLPSGKIREGLELSAHPDFLGKEVLLYGSLETYFGTTGMKSTSWAKINGTEIGQKPGTEIPEGDVKGDGTEKNPYNVAGVLKYTRSLGADVTSDKQVYFTGTVASFKSGEEPGNSYGNATFYITDDSTEEQFYCFRVLGPGNEKFTSADQLKVGDKVTVVGNVVNYKGNTPETSTGKAYVYSINGESTPATGGNEGGDEKPDTPTDTPTGTNLLTNAGFEAWTGGMPDDWKSACTASSAALEQSTDAHAGSYAVVIKGDEGSNKRLAYKELTLAAGTYEFSFYAKATTADASQIRPGYTPVTAGSAGTYVYGDYVNLTTDWALYKHTFTLTAETTVCLVVMNPKKSNYSSGKDVLFDDATLVKMDAAAKKFRR